MTSAPPPLRIGAVPRDKNPYQSLLYCALEDLGVEVSYLGELTPSHSLNTLLLPLEVLVRQHRGLQLVHLHWVFGFRLPGRTRVRAVGLLSQAWYRVFMLTTAASGARLVWTAHNVLPHEPVFFDDIRARRALVDAADLVIAHSPATLVALADLGMYPRAAAIVPHGPFATSAGHRENREATSPRPLTLAYAGAVAPYRGAEDLVAAFASIPEPDARLIVAGGCADRALASRLRSMAGPLGECLELHLDRLSDEQLDRLLDAADVLVLPYREVTTSGMAHLGLAAGLPLVVPDLPGLADLPDGAVFRYGGPDQLAATLERVMATPRAQLRAMGAVGRQLGAGSTWAQIAATTKALFEELVQRTQQAP